MLALIGVASGFVACKAQVLRHDPKSAAKVAEEFLATAVVRQDFRSAYLMFREQDRPNLAEAKFVEVVKANHTDGFPTEVHAVEYEPVPGQGAMQVFLRGSSGAKIFYYRVPVIGTVTEGYAPQGLFRGNMQPPSSPLRRELPQ